MLQPNCLIFPIPRHYNLSQQVKRIKGHLIQVPKLTISHLNGSSNLSDLASTSRDELARRFLLQQIEEIDEIKGQCHIEDDERETIQEYHFLGPKKRPRRITTQQNNMINGLKSMTEHLDTTKFHKQTFKLDSIRTGLSSIKTTARNINSIRLHTQTIRRSISLIETSRNKQQDIQSHIFPYRKIPVQQANNHIPCIHLKFDYNLQQKLFVYYHANAEDLLNSFWFVQQLSHYFKVDLIVVEYPGYSVYNKNQKVCSGLDSITKEILDDIKPVFEYIQLKYKLENVTVIGRSIGTGPAIEVGTRYNVGALILLSPFADFSQVVQNLYGKLAGMIAPQPFDNLNKSSSIKSPVLIIHGLQDPVIHYEQSIKLFSNIKSYCSLKLVSQMTHNKFNFEQDVFANMKEFLAMIRYE